MKNVLENIVLTSANFDIWECIRHSTTIAVKPHLGIHIITSLQTKVRLTSYRLQLETFLQNKLKNYEQ